MEWRSAAANKPAAAAVRTRGTAAVTAGQPEIRYVKFAVKVRDAGKVCIAGDFNKWDEDALRLSEVAKDEWEAMVPLEPGTYKYLCYADGREMLDPLNPDTGTDKDKKVSVITVK